ncbi:MAG TPA: asparaginase [Thermoanaerobaculia bacterium]
MTPPSHRSPGGARRRAGEPPVVARVLRGGRVESVHRGRVAVCDEGGRLTARCGDADTPIYLRSAAKPFQVLPLLEAGGIRAFRLRDDEIAIMCASHGGEPGHVSVVRGLLRKGGFTEKDLVCGAHAPMYEPAARALLARGARPTRLHNNCSGKHAGLLLASRLLGVSPRGYEKPQHPLQRRIRARLAQLAGVPARRIATAVDGCGLPVFFLPLSGLAAAYARLAAGRVPGETAPQRAARRAVWKAFVASPWMVAGTGRFTTEFLEAGRGRWIGKEGAEGVYAVAIRRPRGGAVGVAWKIEDGSIRARDAAGLSALGRLGWLPADARRRLAAHLSPTVHNAAGAVVGAIEADVVLRGRRARS